MEERKSINRLKMVLAEKKCIGKRPAAKPGKNLATVSKWCTNIGQLSPQIDNLFDNKVTRYDLRGIREVNKE